MLKFVKTTALTLCIGLAGTALQAQAKVCSKGVPCGNTCISRNDVCHVGSTSGAILGSTSGSTSPATEAAPTSSGASARASRASKRTGSLVNEATRAPASVDMPSAKSADTQAAQPTKAKQCKRGKPCGNTCIRKDAVCGI